MRIRSKLLLLLAVPLIAVTLAAALGFRSQSVASERAEAAAEAVGTAGVIHDAASAITVERAAALNAPMDGTLTELRERTDARLDELSANASLLGLADLEAVVVEARSELTTGRSAATVVDITASYSAAHQSVLSVPPAVTESLPSNESLNRHIVTHLTIIGAEETQQAWFAYFALPAEPSVAEVTNVAQRFESARQSLVSSRDLARSDDSVIVGELSELRDLELIAIDDLAEGVVSLTPEDVVPALGSFTTATADVVTERDAQLGALIANDLEGAEGLRSLFSLLAAVGVLVLGGMVFVIYRSIAHPLNDLLERADVVAHEDLPRLVTTLRHSDGQGELPQPKLIPTESDDEISELVEAFNEVQTTAYALATEQALGRKNVSDMFVNLGRRNQQLLQRMLNMLTELQQDEEDPDQLEQLFHLDNIVTRMRRNAESLLVLAGGQTARQWSAPIAVDDAVRAAFGEVEGYERIDIAALAPTKIRGNVVTDVAHLLAELLENAISFSDASTKVLVNGQFERDGYLITIFDQGIGMDEQELADANSRISDPPPLDQVPTRFLGLFVVGRLADRHGIEARLLEAPGRGVMARIHLPGGLLDRDEGELINEPTNSEADLLLPLLTEERSPLELNHDIESEWAEIAPDTDVDAVETNDDAELVDEPSILDDSTVEDSTVDPELTNDEALDTSPIDTGSIDTGTLPVRPRRASDDTSTATDTAPTTAVDGSPEAETVSPDRAPTGVSDPGESGLPTRQRGAALTDSVEMPKRRSSDDAAPSSEADATRFSSVMSALSSGISRGLEESRVESEFDDPIDPIDSPIAADTSPPTGTPESTDLSDSERSHS